MFDVFILACHWGIYHNFLCCAVCLWVFLLSVTHEKVSWSSTCLINACVNYALKKKNYTMFYLLHLPDAQLVLPPWSNNCRESSQWTEPLSSLRTITCFFFHLSHHWTLQSYAVLSFVSLTTSPTTITIHSMLKLVKTCFLLFFESYTKQTMDHCKKSGDNEKWFLYICINCTKV